MAAISHCNQFPFRKPLASSEPVVVQGTKKQLLSTSVAPNTHSFKRYVKLTTGMIMTANTPNSIPIAGPASYTTIRAIHSKNRPLTYPHLPVSSYTNPPTTITTRFPINPTTPSHITPKIQPVQAHPRPPHAMTILPAHPRPYQKPQDRNRPS